jgi:hypothetical protein
LAKETLDQCLVDDLSESDQILYTILQVQVGMALEAATMEQTAQEDHKADQNRSLSTSMADCRSKSCQQVLSQSNDTLSEVALTLPDTVVKIWAKPEKNEA